MGVRMKVLQPAVGGHDPRVLKGSTPEDGINWEMGDEIEVTPELASKFEASGMAYAVPDPVAIPESAAFVVAETATQLPARRRARV